MKKIISAVMVFAVMFLYSCNAKVKPQKIEKLPETVTTVGDTNYTFSDSYNHTECSDGSPHNYTSTAHKATCTERGYTTNTCKKCGYIHLSETENALGHTWGEPIISKNVTCTEDGLQVSTCSLCRETKEETIQHSGHNYVSVEKEENFDFENYGPDEDISFAKDDGVTTFVCSVCNDIIAIGDNENFPEPIEDVKMLMGRDTMYSFLVACDEGEEYINSNLTIINTFTNETIEFEVEKENDVYRVSPKTPYEEYGVYKAMSNENISFVDYSAKALEFEIKGPDKTNVKYNDDNLVFLKALEQNSPGYYPYVIEEDEAAGKQYLTLSKTGELDSSHIGKVICVGDYLNSAELLEDITKEVYLGKINRIYRNADGKTEIELSSPEISDVFDELEVYSNGGFGSTDVVMNEDFEDEFKASVMESDNFINYAVAMSIAAKDYAEDMNVVATSLWDDAFKDAVDFKFTKKDIRSIEDGKIKIDIEGTLTYTVPLKTKAGKSVGDITMVCTAGADSELHFSGYFYKDLSAHLGVYADSNARLSFELKFNLKQSLSNEIRYYVNNKTDTIHTGTCRMVTKVTDVSNLSIYTASELLHLYNGDRVLMKSHECGICKAVTGLDGSAYILNNNTNTLHCLNCYHVDSIDECNIYEIYPKDVRGFETCDNCRPQERQGKDFEKRMQNAMAGSDWGEQINDLKATLEKSEDNSKSESRGIVIGYVPFNFMGVFNVNFKAELVFDFDLEATVKANYTTGSEVWFGVHIKSGEYVPYYEEEKKTSTHTFDVTGKIGAELGFRFTAEANVITEHLACIKLFAEVGVYCDVSGILHSEYTSDGKGNSYFAAHLEIGLYYLVDGYWKILGWDDSFPIVGKNKIPCLERGYSRAYYAFESYDQILTIDEEERPYKCLINADCMEVLYLDLGTLKTNAEHLAPLGNDDYSIKYSFINEDGSKNENFTVSKSGFLMLKDDAPKDFTAYMQITVEPKKAPISSIKEFFASKYSRTSYGYFIDTNTVKIVVTLEDEEKLYEATEKDFKLLETFLTNHRMDRDYNCETDIDFNLNFDYYFSLNDMGNAFERMSDRTQSLGEALGMSEGEISYIIQNMGNNYDLGLIDSLYRERYLESECEWIVKKIYNSDNYELFKKQKQENSKEQIERIISSLNISSYGYNEDAIFNVGFCDEIYNSWWQSYYTPFIGYTCEVASAERLTDGKYKIVYNLYKGEDNSSSASEGTGTAIMSVKEYKGHRYWSVYSIDFISEVPDYYAYAQMYTDYLHNEYEWPFDPKKCEIETCLVDIDEDGSYECLLCCRVENEENGEFDRFYLILGTSSEGVEVCLDTKEALFDPVCDCTLGFLYDTVSQKHILWMCEARTETGKTLGYDKLSIDYEKVFDRSVNDIFITCFNVNIDDTYFVHVNMSYNNWSDKPETEYSYEMEHGELYEYREISETEYYNYLNRFIDVQDSKYAYVKATYEDPFNVEKYGLK